MKQLLMGVLLILAQTTAFAESVNLASIERLLEVTQAQQLSEGIMQQADVMIKNTFNQALASKNLSPEKKQQAEQFLNAFAEDYKKILAEEFSWKQLKEFTIQLYQENFTQEEIDGLIAFYESPTGKAFVKKMPLVSQKSLAMVQQRMVPIMQKLKRQPERS